MECFHQDAMTMEAGFLILLVMCVLHYQQVITISTNDLHAHNNFSSHTTANCGEPSPPSDGYLEPHTSTSEGARVKRVHVCQNGQLEVEEIVCNSYGKWEVRMSSVCTTKPSIPNINIFSSLRMHSTYTDSLKPDTNVIIGASLGSLFGVVVSCCVVLVVFIIIKWKGQNVISYRSYLTTTFGFMLMSSYRRTEFNYTHYIYYNYDFMQLINLQV